MSTIRTSTATVRRSRVALLSLGMLIASGLTTLVTVAPAQAAGCSLPTGAGTVHHTKHSVLSQASATETVTWRAGTELTGKQFITYLQNGHPVYSSNLAPDALGYYRGNGDYSFPVNLKADGCKSIVLVGASNGSRQWLDVCVAPSPGQDHNVCNWNLPEGLLGYLEVGLYDPASRTLTLTTTHSPILT
jgi:hypothetical protein